MRPVDFDYAAPEDIAGVVQALVDGGDDAKIISGGQSLMPVLRMRMAAPELLVDLRKVDGLREIRQEGSELVIGAMVTHHTLATDPLVAEHAGLLAQAAATIGDAQIRYRGTIGGALAHADPAGDLGAAVLALDGSVDIVGPAGERTVGAAEFFQDYFTTAVGEDDVAVAVRIPSHAGWGSCYEKFTVVAQAWAVVAVGATLRIADGVIQEAKVAMANMGPTPLRASQVEAALAGAAVDAGTLDAAGSRAGEGTNPPEDSAGTPEYRRHLAGVLARRALRSAAGVE
ncbi:MAG: xanthine dehydrogenase family protein subunit M [Actinomycetales bacterium]|nr:xanthine dehydrogenase family protein subunit M [Actinomycetales bacterium]